MYNNTSSDIIKNGNLIIINDKIEKDIIHVIGMRNKTREILDINREPSKRSN